MKEIDYLENQGVDGILPWILRKQAEINLAGCCTNGDEPSDFTDCGEFVNSIRTVSYCRKICCMDSASKSIT
jgi:hypothetical protein